MVSRKGKRKAGDVKKKSVKAKVTNKMNSKRRLSRMGKRQKMGHRGIAAAFVTRGQALRQLQVSLKDFRRLCILKGIYPRENRKSKRSLGKDKVYYHVKDVAFLMHEPLLDKFRQFKTFLKKLNKAMAKKVKSEVKRREAVKPEYTLDHVVKERYPTFVEALEDLDDALCMVHLFATLPAEAALSIDAKVTAKCEVLCREWQYFVCASRSLVKTFVSIKGIYYQARVLGVDVTWLVPHAFPQAMPEEVDFRVMLTFLEFYDTLLRFINFKLFGSLGLVYPPRLSKARTKGGAHLSALKLQPDQASRAARGERGGRSGGRGGARRAAAAEAASSDQQPEQEQELEQQRKSEERIASLQEGVFAAHAGEGEGEGADAARGATAEDDDDEATMLQLDKAFAGNEHAQQIQQLAAESQAKAQATRIFDGMHFFLGRETALAPLEFVIRSFGGTACWEGDGSGSTSDDPSITHRVVDRPATPATNAKGEGEGTLDASQRAVELVQPQWVFDSVNAQLALPIKGYVPGAALPPHLSPFVDDAAEGYVPEYRQELQRLQSARDAAIARGPDAGSDSGEDGSDGDDAEDEGREDDETRYVRELQAEAAGLKPEGNKGRHAGSDDSDDEDGEDDDDSDDDDDDDDDDNDDGSEEQEEAPKPKAKAKSKKAAEAEAEHELALSMMPKKAKRLYDRMQRGISKKNEAVQALERKRDALKSEAAPKSKKAKRKASKKK